MIKKKKVLFVYSDMGDGGIQKTLLLLSESLGKKHDLHLAIFKDLRLFKFYGTVKYLEAPTSKNPFLAVFNFFKRIKRLGRYIEEEKFDVIFSRSVISNSVLLITKILFRIKTPCIISFENAFEKKTKVMGISGTISRKLNVFLSRYSDKIISVSKGLSDELANVGMPAGKIITIYNPLNIRNIEILKREKIEEKFAGIFKGQLPVIISTGRFTKQKNYSLLLNSFKSVLASVKCNLVLFGDGKEKVDLIALSENLGIRENVFFPGWVKNPYKYMAASDIFVLPSLWEGFGIVIAEAMACGVPVISSNCDFGPSEIVSDGKSGLLFKVNDEMELTAKIIFLLKNKKIAKKFVSEGKKSLQKFEIDFVTKEYNELIINSRKLISGD